MRICKTYPDNTTKLCHHIGGDVVTLHNNDGTPDPQGFFMVMSKRGASAAGTTEVVNLANGSIKIRLSSSRCIHYPTAILEPDGDDA